MEGRSVMVLYFTFQTRTSRWSDLDGSNPSISPGVSSVLQLPALQFRPPDSRPERSNILINISTFHARSKGGHLFEEVYSDSDINTADHDTSDPTTQVYTYPSADGTPSILTVRVQHRSL